jgi:hypothetical protein
LTEEDDLADDSLDRACAQVGRFLYHFANLENQVDAGLVKLFELSSNTADMIKGSVDFLKRFNLVRTATLYQIRDQNDERKRVDKILKKVIAHNNDRQVAAHSRFEPAGDGVKFTRVVARDGTVTIPDETWSKHDFETKYGAMQELVQQLEQVVAQVKPAKNYVLSGDTGRYHSMFFSPSFFSAPSLALLASEGADED